MSLPEYDFVIVGGGTAGLVVASRLSECPKTQVLVLEAGIDRSSDPRIHTPALWKSLQGDADFDWNYESEPQEGLDGRSLPHPQGRALGGSSSINAHAFMAPSKTQIDAWGKIGNPGWNFETLKPYFQKSHTLNLPSDAVREHMSIDYIDDEISGRSGPIQVSFPEDKNAISQAWINTFKTLGYALTDDPFSGKGVGGFSNSLTLDPKTKTRSSSAQYYKLAQNRPNLHLETGVEVEKILLDYTSNSSDVVARGVQYSQNGKSLTVHARLEVVVAAGAFNTPRLLELSGIGNANTLRSHGIEVKVHNPFVGENLQDHLMSGISFELPDQLPEGVVTMDGLVRGEPEVLQAAMQAYKTEGSGPLSVGAVTSYSYMPLVDLVNGEQGQTELKRLLDQHIPGPQKDFPSQKFQYDFLRKVLEDPNEATASYFLTPVQSQWDNGILPGNWITLGACYLTPFSRGSIHIASADPTKKAILNPGYLNHPLDLELHARHLQYLETITATQPLAGFLKPDGKRGAESAQQIKSNLDAAKTYLKKTVLSNWHSTSTCSMMPREMGGVVSPRLIVYGTKNLRIVDSSIMPMIPRANTQSTVYAVAERAADMIKEEHSLVV